MLVESPLQGAIGYLLIAEVVIVAGLVWVLIGLVLKRLKHPHTEPVTDIEKTEAYQALQAKLSQLEEEKSSLITQLGQSGDSEKLQKTIAFLENKLLSYEIVQEEISVLGELKAENEKLRAELSTFKKDSVPPQVEQVINEKFSEFAAESQSKPESMPGEIQNLLSDIESLTKDKEKS